MCRMCQISKPPSLLQSPSHLFTQQYPCCNDTSHRTSRSERKQTSALVGQPWLGINIFTFIIYFKMALHIYLPFLHILASQNLVQHSHKTFFELQIQFFHQYCRVRQMLVDSGFLQAGKINANIFVSNSFLLPVPKKYERE